MSPSGFSNLKTYSKGRFYSWIRWCEVVSTFKYERLPIFCHYCGILGHDLKHCAVHYAVEKKGGRIEYQYGDFLRAMGGRPRALGSKEAGQNYVNEDSKGCEVEKSFVQAEQDGPLGRMEAHVLSPGNASNTDKANSVFQGKGAELTHVDSVNINCHANVTGTNSEIEETAPKNQHFEQLATGLTKVGDTDLINPITGEGHVEPLPLEGHSVEPRSLTSTSNLIGPSNSKPKGTWTRINRMDFGLSGFTKSITLPGLGKRETCET